MFTTIITYHERCTPWNAPEFEDRLAAAGESAEIGGDGGRDEGEVGKENTRETDMGKKHGSFAWHDCMTTDVDAAIDYYGKVLGLGT
ncbi:MAG: hypothetical protein IIA27_10735, partial [Gemmatimonadetes bacterium]|nr:hypothetical protein [Gemmatimonadota bacterium]